jgi:hypothetical protein
MTKIPLQDAVQIIRDFGLLINQVSIYGVAHKSVTEQAILFFNTLKRLVTRYHFIEFALQGDRLAINGSPEGIDLMISRNLKEKMVLQKLPGISFLPMLTQQEFITFLSYLGMPVVKLQEQGGFEAVIKRANLKGIRLVHFAYERVDEKKEKKAHVPNYSTSRGSQTTAPRLKAPVELSLNLDDLEALQESSRFPVPTPEGSNYAPTQARMRRKQVHAELNALLDEVTHLFSTDGTPPSEAQNQQMVDTLRTIRDTLRKSTEPSKERIATLLAQPEEPAPKSWPHEKKPATFNLTHAEFMGRYAELTQELAQPLTVTNGVIELLRQGQAGALNEAQMQFLDLALESVDRVNQLIKYMHTLSGEPDSYTPNAALINETYI